MRLLAVVWLFTYAAGAQQVCWVEFTHKDSAYSLSQPQQFLSKKAISRRAKFDLTLHQTDLPVSPQWLAILHQKGYTVLSKSKWLNAAVVLISNESEEEVLRQLPFIKAVSPLGKYEVPAPDNRFDADMNEILRVLESKNGVRQKKDDTLGYGKSLNQVKMLKTNQLHSLGLMGEGMDIAVIDAGFNNADTLPAFHRLKSDHRIKATYDFVQHHAEVYEDDYHGLAVLSCMAGYIPGEYIGTAPMANYYLLRSEYAQSEMPIEEAYWIAAIEYADSAGADIVNSSLGYNEYDDLYFSYAHKNLDGKTAIISKAASMAVQKGMVVVVSAGNEGNDDWRLISVPADAPEVITVGGVDAWQNLVIFSSTGPTADQRIKPDVMAQADNVWVASARGFFYQSDGTSFSCPLITGSIACLMQAYPKVSPKQLMDVLHASGSFYHHPDEYIGFGVPDMYLAYLMLQADTSDAIIDVRVLSDKRIHATLRLAMPQKTEVKVTDNDGREVLTETISVKNNGVIRLPLKKIKRFSKGIYSLQWATPQGVKLFTFQYD
jgi:hypothetical protein